MSLTPQMNRLGDWLEEPQSYKKQRLKKSMSFKQCRTDVVSTHKNRFEKRIANKLLDFLSHDEKACHLAHTFSQD